MLARVYADKRGASVDANQELVALGLVNVAAGLFQGRPVSGIQSRTPVAEARTQLTGVAAAALLLGVVVGAPEAFRNLPQPVLAAVVVAAALRVFAIGPLVRLAAIQRSEFLLGVAAFLAVAILGAIVGVVVAIALSLLNFMRKVWKPHTAELVRVDRLKGYHDNERHPEGRRIADLLFYFCTSATRPAVTCSLMPIRSLQSDWLQRQVSPSRTLVCTLAWRSSLKYHLTGTLGP